ncbi:hypothetical protein HOT49_gp270 [Erwinia phage vB_EamM_Alexandra]|uniref:Uncharacterized protein n=1 Tax=Erwinia phage vB_EamM_Alexandra TaxID=2201424 RepID=A0A2Z4QER2_9CAUD|nr:hypothetical protein HOT49_gp270 [Erwinia phage vB_EamM_Alexandra]AWY08529.1 hypothetical protein Alexandra_272 [Erwinia phage vB_EamM_Alexandra]
MLLAWVLNLPCRYRAYRDRFKLEMVDAFIALPAQDQQLLCKALDVSNTPEGLEKFFDTSRKDLAKKCGIYYVHLTRDSKLLYVFQRVIHNIRTRK